MAKLILLIITLALYTTIFSQEIREVRSFHNNGKESHVVYKDQELRVKRIESFDANGKKISSYEIDPITQMYNGNFFNTLNNGSYNQGVLNCTNCTLHPGTALIKGNFKNGRPIGEVDFFSVKEGTLLQYETGPKVDQGETGIYDIEYKMSINYNNNGDIHGKVIVDSTTSLYFDNGKLNGFVIKNDDNLNYTKDSVFRENKVWKVNNQFIKNAGWLLRLDWDEFNDPWNFNFEFSGDYNDKYRVFFGSELSETELKYVNGYYRPIISYTAIDENIIFIRDRKNLLSNSGLYVKGKQKNEKMLRHLVSSIYSIAKNKNLFLNDIVDISYNDEDNNKQYIELKGFNSILDYTDSILKTQSEISEIFILNEETSDDKIKKINYINYLQIYDTLILNYQKDKEYVDKNLIDRVNKFNLKCSSLRSSNERILTNLKELYPKKYSEIKSNLPWFNIVKDYEINGFKSSSMNSNKKYFYLNFYENYGLHATNEGILQLCKLNNDDFEKWLNAFYKSFSTEWLFPHEWSKNLEKRHLIFKERVKNISNINNENLEALTKLWPERHEHPNNNEINHYEKIGFRKNGWPSKNYFQLIYWNGVKIEAGYDAVDYLCKLSDDEFNLWLGEFVSIISSEFIFYSDEWVNKITSKLASSEKIEYSSDKGHPNFSPEFLARVKDFQKNNSIKIKNVNVYRFATEPIFFIELKSKNGYNELLEKVTILKKDLSNKALLSTSENQNILITSVNIFLSK
tara:strand:+ start:591 stop:2816 length:2226 start_codon:yes stop_codon:yes gene_type:complete